MGRVHPTRARRLAWLPADTLEVLFTERARGQRTFIDAWARELARNFDPDAIGLPLVATLERRDGTHYYIVDGQHRIAALRLALGEGQHVQCEIVDGLTEPEIANSFLRRNASKQVRVLDKFLSAVSSGWTDETEIVKILSRFGLRVSSATSDGSITAVSALLAVWNGDVSRSQDERRRIMERVIGVLSQAWGNRYDAYGAEIIRGLGLVIGKYGDEIDDAALSKRLAGISGGPSGLIGRGRSVRDGFGGTVARGVAHAVIAEWNKGKRSGRLPGFLTDQGGTA